MHELTIKNHRGCANLKYYNLNDTAKHIKNFSYELLLLDESLLEFHPKIINKFSFIKEKIFLNAGENTKTLEGVFSLLKKIDDLKIYPINNVLLIGGASLQDTVATALSLLKRGTNWSYIPTTLLSQADSCIGSKTSINSENSKNLYGTFYSPSNIYILPEFLKTLPDMEIISGIGDAMHYLLLEINANLEYVKHLIEYLLIKTPSDFINDIESVEKLCYKCHEIKKIFIESDEFDQNIRKVLNLGHSFGHALESFLNYKIPHGIGVLFGLIIASDISFEIKDNYFEPIFKNNLITIRFLLIQLLEKFSPLEPKYIWKSLKKDPKKFIDILAKDKKNTTKGKFKLILFIKNKPLLYECEKSLVLNYIKNRL